MAFPVNENRTNETLREWWPGAIRYSVPDPADRTTTRSNASILAPSRQSAIRVPGSAHSSEAASGPGVHSGGSCEMWGGAQACTSGSANVARNELLDGNRFIFRAVSVVLTPPEVAGAPKFGVTPPPRPSRHWQGTRHLLLHRPHERVVDLHVMWPRSDLGSIELAHVEDVGDTPPGSCRTLRPSRCRLDRGASRRGT